MKEQILTISDPSKVSDLPCQQEGMQTATTYMGDLMEHQNFACSQIHAADNNQPEDQPRQASSFEWSMSASGIRFP